jgi:hypothetical protein
MTGDQAIKEAKRLLGPQGCTCYIRNKPPELRCLVGEILPGMTFGERGIGRSWEDAFKDSRRRKRRS